MSGVFDERGVLYRNSWYAVNYTTQEWVFGNKDDLTLFLSGKGYVVMPYASLLDVYTLGQFEKWDLPSDLERVLLLDWGNMLYGLGSNSE